MSKLANYVKNPAKRAEFIFGQPMEPCPKCKGYSLKQQTPIVMEEILSTDGARQILGKWARARRGGVTPLEGPVFIACAACGHKGPAVDCTGRTREEVGQDPKISAEMKRLWNGQSD